MGDAMTRKLFGTDGIRGKANSEPMTAQTALCLAMAAGLMFRRGDHRHRVVIGKDTRLSGYMIEPALTAGFISMGMDVMLVGPMPTPAVAMLTRSMRADLGVVISASHNPYHDNGIKLFGPDGFKLSDDLEAEIEEHMTNGVEEHLAPSDMLGRAQRIDDAPGRYMEFAKYAAPKGLRLDDLKIVIDCAHGAAYRAAPTVLWELGAEVVPIGVSPDGKNINAGCGAAHPEAMCEAVVAHGADVGIALDGDADRVVMADEGGRLLDGDQLIAVIAGNWLDNGRLHGDSVVTTVMSNIGLERHLAAMGLGIERTKVGDRYVVEHMRANGQNLGGEQSGHIIMIDHMTTGDGLIAALQVLAVLTGSGRPASDVLRPFEPSPQLLKNVPANGISALDDPRVVAAIAAAESRLGKAGRLVIRPSGTEPLIRVMAEGDDDSLIGKVVDDVAGAIAEVGRS